MMQKTINLLEELDWFHDSGVSAALTLQTLGKSWDTVERTCCRLGRHDLAAWIRADFGADKWLEQKAKAA